MISLFQGNPSGEVLGKTPIGRITAFVLAIELRAKDGIATRSGRAVKSLGDFARKINYCSS